MPVPRIKEYPLDLHRETRLQQDGRRRIEIEIRPHRRTVELEVKDNGPGFSSEALKMAMQPFYSDRSKGTGLGLAIARRIVEDHGGTLSLQNRPTGGACVCLIFNRTGRG